MTPAAYLVNLIQIQSVSSSSNRAIVEYVCSVLRRAGWTTREIAYTDANNVEKVNVIAAPPLQDVSIQSVDLAFVCHTDTVPFLPSWGNALKPFIESGYLYGCGACDVKGFLACLLHAACSEDSSNWIEGLRIILTADEEIGCVGAKHLLKTDLIRSKRFVIGEPTSLHVARAGKGYCLSEVDVEGAEAHSAHPEQGASAILAASRMIRRIEELALKLTAERNELFSPAYTSINIGTIEGGSAKNIIAGRCKFLVEWRPIPGLNQEYVPAALEAFAEELMHNSSRIRCTVRQLREEAAFETAENATLVRALVESTGRAATSIPFGSEASVFTRLAEETVVFGPGDMRTAHSDRECVPLVELDEAALVLRRLMRSGLQGSDG